METLAETLGEGRVDRREDPPELASKRRNRPPPPTGRAGSKETKYVHSCTVLRLAGGEEGVRVCVYYCSAYSKAVRVEDMCYERPITH